jgi:hypothetical protein
MRFSLSILVLALSITPALTARAASRVVDDTFRAQRAQHLDDIEQTRQKFHDDGVKGETDREAKAAKTDEQRRDHLGKIDNASAGWRRTYDDETGKRDAARKVMEQDRIDHQAKIEPKPGQWWDDLNK